MRSVRGNHRTARSLQPSLWHQSVAQQSSPSLEAPITKETALNSKLVGAGEWLADHCLVYHEIGVLFSKVIF